MATDVKDLRSEIRTMKKDISQLRKFGFLDQPVKPAPVAIQLQPPQGFQQKPAPIIQQPQASAPSATKVLPTSPQPTKVVITEPVIASSENIKPTIDFKNETLKPQTSQSPQQESSIKPLAQPSQEKPAIPQQPAQPTIAQNVDVPENISLIVKRKSFMDDIESLIQNN